MFRKKITVAVSGGFDPLHIGHLQMFESAKRLGDVLVVIINGDSWLIRKKGKIFMTAEDRKTIIEGLRCVDYTFIHNSKTDHVCGALEKIKPDIFANGGDRKNEEDIPEADTCKKLGIQMVFNVGGSKIRSSNVT